MSFAATPISGALLRKLLCQHASAKQGSAPLHHEHQFASPPPSASLLRLVSAAICATACRRELTLQSADTGSCRRVQAASRPAAKAPIASMYRSATGSRSVPMKIHSIISHNAPTDSPKLAIAST